MDGQDHTFQRRRGVGAWVGFLRFVQVALTHGSLERRGEEKGDQEVCLGHAGSGKIRAGKLSQAATQPTWPIPPMIQVGLVVGTSQCPVDEDKATFSDAGC